VTPPFFKWAVRVVAALFGIALTAAALVAIVMNTAGGTRWALARIDAALPGQLVIDDFDGTLFRGLRIPSLQYRDDAVEVEVSRLQVEIDWSTLPAGRLSLAVVTADTVSYHSLTLPEPAPFQLSLQPLPVSFAVRRASVGELVLTNPDSRTEVNNLSLRDARLDGVLLQARKAAAAFSGTAVTLTGTAVELSGDVPASARVDWLLVDGDWSGSGRVRGTLRELSFSQDVAGPYACGITGTVKLLDRVKPEFDLVVFWDAWSFGDMALADGEVRLAGHPDHYLSDFDTRLSAPRGLQFSLAGSASGNTSGLETLDISLSGPAGSAGATGSMTWRPGISADLRVTMRDAIIGDFLEQASGTASAFARIEVDGLDRVTTSDLEITGIINGQTTSARGTFVWTPDEQTCSACAFAVGDNQLSLDGRVRDQTLDLRLDFDGKAIEQLYPAVSGRARVQGRLAGPLRQPAFSGTATGHDLAYAGWMLERAEVRSRSVSTDALEVSVGVANLRGPDGDLGSFAVTGRGSTADLDFELDWTLHGLGAQFKGRLQPTDTGVTGNLQASSITESNTGTWRLATPFEFRYSDTSLAVAEHSWVNGESRLDLRSLEWRPDELDVTASLSALPLALANPWLPAHLSLLGRADASVEVQQRAGRWDGSLRWRQEDTVLRVAEVHDEVTDVRIPAAELTAEIRENALDARAVVAVEPGVSGELDLRLADLHPDAALDAEFRLQGDDWSWVSAVVPQIDSLQGSVEGRIGARGSLRAPEFEGEAVWLNGGVLVPALNLPLSDIELRVVGGSQGSATLIGSATAGTGTLRISGRAEDLSLPERTLRIEISGDNAQLSDWPDRRIWASPDLVIVGSLEGWQFDGSVALDRTSIVMKELPEGAVTVSPDVTVLGAPPAETRRTLITGEALLTLGEQVRVSALGLDTALEGELRIRQPRDRGVVAEGRISLVDAIFTAYGQRLTIREGELTFTGPLDDPLVDATAIREIDTLEGKVIAGVRLRGRAKDLTTTVFAEPAMAEADALSYLVLGRPISEATASEGTDLSGAAMTLGIKQAARLTEQIGQSLGLDQLSLSGYGGDSTALIAGKQINSRLYARYAYGVFSRLGVLLLRYRVTERLVLEAATGEVQSIDVLYSVEKP
jgi:translocation and assembly module TamB